MTINVTCQCGKRIAVKDEFAGKRVKCPGCGGPLLIPQTTPARGDDGHCISDLLDDVGMKSGVARCPGCGAEMAAEAVLCVMCGFDLRRGHRLKTRVGSAINLDDEDLGDLPVHGVSQLDEAERNIARAILQEKQLTKGAPWWMIFLALLGLVGFAVSMVAMPQDQVMQNSGMVLQVAGGLLSFFFFIQLLIAGFKDSLLHGLGILLVPLYALVYAIIRWDRVGGIFIFILIGNLLSFIGFGMVQFLAPMFEATPE
jgi:hypothetical protein